MSGFARQVDAIAVALTRTRLAQRRATMAQNRWKRMDRLERWEGSRASNDQVIKTRCDEIRSSEEQTRRVLIERMERLFNRKERLMRLLHEDLVERIARLSEGR